MFIGVGTGGATGAMVPHFSAKIILRIFPFILTHNFYTENDSPGRGKHKSCVEIHLSRSKFHWPLHFG